MFRPLSSNFSEITKLEFRILPTVLFTEINPLTSFFSRNLNRLFTIAKEGYRRGLSRESEGIFSGLKNHQILTEVSRSM